ncbi:MAG: hypothetical protein LDL41_13380 [Coleofasciculus sp. S288]|nr:hypothetical protein [Coleofasciculus sp. S288]
MSDFQTIHQILFAYQRLTNQYEETLDRDLETLYEQIVTDVINLRRHEELWLAARSNWVKKLRPFLESDARCLLSTNQFSTYLEPLLFLNQSGSLSPNQRIAATPSAWVLGQVDFPLSLSEYQAIYENDIYSYLLTAKLNSWQQQFKISVVSLQGNSNEFFDANEQWQEALNQLQPNFKDLCLSAEVLKDSSTYKEWGQNVVF